eukprot:4538418-Karenia_brevis.AAC.2
MGDVSGSPCQLWSRAGKRQKTTSHLIILFLVWCLWARHARPWVLIHENVQDFEGSLLQKFLGDLYCMVELKVCPGDVGFNFSKRARKYSILFLRGVVREEHSIAGTYERVKQGFAEQHMHVPASACFVASIGGVSPINKTRHPTQPPEAKRG